MNMSDLAEVAGTGVCGVCNERFDVGDLDEDFRCVGCRASAVLGDFLPGSLPDPHPGPLPGGEGIERGAGGGVEGTEERKVWTKLEAERRLREEAAKDSRGFALLRAAQIYVAACFGGDYLVNPGARCYVSESGAAELVSDKEGTPVEVWIEVCAAKGRVHRSAHQAAQGQIEALVAQNKVLWGRLGRERELQSDFGRVAEARVYSDEVLVFQPDGGGLPRDHDCGVMGCGLEHVIGRFRRGGSVLEEVAGRR